MLALFFIINANGQLSAPMGLWQTVNAEVVLNSKWSAFGEGQIRSQKLSGELYFNELNTSINFKPKKSISILAGFAHNNTYSNGGNFKKPVINSEKRCGNRWLLFIPFPGCGWNIATGLNKDGAPPGIKTGLEYD